MSSPPAARRRRPFTICVLSTIEIRHRHHADIAGHAIEAVPVNKTPSASTSMRPRRDDDLIAASDICRYRH
jgi:hypothetical protein